MATLDRLGAGTGDGTAVIFDGRAISHAELNRQAAEFARFLKDELSDRDLIAILLPNCPELLCACIACWRAGMIPVPVNAQLKRPEVRQLLNQARIRNVLTSRDVAASLENGFSGTGVEWVGLVEPRPGSEPGTLLRAERHEGGEVEPHARLPDDLGLILHTSGTTGRPRGVMLSRENLNHILDDRLAQTGMKIGSVAIVASCLTQSVGLYQGLALLAAGGTMALLRSYDAGQMAEAVNRHPPTHLIMVVEAFDKLLHHPDVTGRSLARIEFAAVGADRVTARVQDRFIALTGRPLRTTYGLTESSWALIDPAERTDKRLSLGTAGAGVAIRLLDAQGAGVADGETGEIHIRSPRTMIGYLNDEVETRAVLRNGWLATGDLACRDADGYYWFRGRSKNLINLRSGDTVSPVEIENILLGHSGVRGCCVIGVVDDDGSELPWAFVAGEGTLLAEAALREFLRSRISDYKVPRRIVTVPELPVGASGKVCRDSLRNLAIAIRSGFS